MRGLATFMKSSLSILVHRAKELAIDATYGINNLGTGPMFLIYFQFINYPKYGVVWSVSRAGWDKNPSVLPLYRC